MSPMRRFLKLFSNNPLLATIAGTIIGGLILAWLLAMKVPDMGGVLGATGHWLSAPTEAKRVDLITLMAASFTLGFIGFAAIFMHEAKKAQRLAVREQQPAARQELARFAPETLELTPLRSRALLA